jgi:hypothetical protein
MPRPEDVARSIPYALLQPDRTDIVFLADPVRRAGDLSEADASNGTASSRLRVPRRARFSARVHGGTSTRTRSDTRTASPFMSNRKAVPAPRRAFRDGAPPAPTPAGPPELAPFGTMLGALNAPVSGGFGNRAFSGKSPAIPRCFRLSDTRTRPPHRVCAYLGPRSCLGTDAKPLPWEARRRPSSTSNRGNLVRAERRSEQHPRGADVPLPVSQVIDPATQRVLDPRFRMSARTKLPFPRTGHGGSPAALFQRQPALDLATSRRDSDESSPKTSVTQAPARPRSTCWSSARNAKHLPPDWPAGGVQRVAQATAEG